MIELSMKQGNLEQIRKKYGLELILLYGSQVTGKLHTESDVDVGIVRRQQANRVDLPGLIYEFAQYFGTDRVDIADLTHANPLLIFAATKQARLLAGREEDFASLQLKAFKRYCDYLPYLKREQEFVQESLKNI